MRKHRRGPSRAPAFFRNPEDARVSTDTQTNGNQFTYWGGQNNVVPGQSLLLIGRRNIEGGDRQDDIRHTAYRMNIGARGDLGNCWSYDVYGQYGIALLSESYLNEMSKYRVQQALEVDPVTGECIGNSTNPPSSVGCVPLDIFNGLGSITPAMEAYAGANGFKEGWTQEQVVSGSLTGDLGEWGDQRVRCRSGGGDLGVERRRWRRRLRRADRARLVVDHGCRHAARERRRWRWQQQRGPSRSRIGSAAEQPDGRGARWAG